MFSLFATLSWILAAVFTMSSLVAEENAALVERGARIEVTCKHPKPLNERWHKPHEMLRAQRPYGPIINDLTTGEITVFLPVPLNVIKVGIRQSDYKGGFAIAKDVALSAQQAQEKKLVLTNAPEQVQFFDYAARTDRIRIGISSVYPPAKGPQDRKYGGITQVQVIVSDDLDKLFAIPDNYASGLPTFVMRTPNLDPQAAPDVTGKPRKVTGHPCTIWDKQDIRELKAQIARHPQAKEAYDGIVAFCEKACAMRMVVPDEPDLGTNPKVGRMHNAVATGIGNLGIGYALSGKEKYAQEARRLLLELAKRYEGWPLHRHPKFTHDNSKWSWQRLGDAIWLIPAAWGFDLIHESPSLSDEDRKTIGEHFVLPCVKNIMRHESIIAAPTNWSAICSAAVMIGARAVGHKEYYEKSYLGLTRKIEDKRGGLFFHLDKGIDDDGMWAEGAIGYQFMAIRGLLVMAEILWHDGIDAYGYRNGRLKKVFDSPIWYCYPGGRTSPAIHDSGSSDLFGRDAHLYQYARRRYSDQTYNAILCNVTPTLESVFNLFLPACEFGPVNAADLPRVPSVLFPGVGFAIARTGDGDESRYLLLDYGPNRSHGHPDKLSFCLYGLGQELFADAGSAWYSTDIYKRYYSHSLAHNTVTANEVSQIMTGGKLEAYGSCGDLSLIRASCDSAIPSCVLDRTLFLSGDRLYDITMVLSGIPFTFDLPYHCYGKLDQKIATSPWKDHPKEKAGYSYFKEPLSAKVDGKWKCSWSVPRGRVDLHTVGEPGSEIVFATTPKGGADLPTAMIRRRGTNTTFASVIDLVPNGKAPSIQSVSRILLPDNRGYALKTELATGGHEVLMTSFSKGTLAFGDWRTDARTAFVQVRDGRLSAFYMAGGTILEGPAGRVESSEPTLLAYRVVKEGLAQFLNQCGTASQVTLKDIAPADSVCAVGPDGARLSIKAIEMKGDSAVISSVAFQKAELISGTQPTVAEHTARLRREKVVASLARERKEREAIEKQMTAQYARAKASGIPDDYFVLLQAEKFVSEGGGKVTITKKKVATFGDAFLKWDNRGHWIDYDFDVAHEGYYQVIFKYCREGGPVTRSLQIDGTYPSEAARGIEMPGTGGWSNGADNWKLYHLKWPLIGKPFFVFLKAGKRRLRVENVSGGGLNLDYILFAAPFLDVRKDLVEK